MSPTETFLAEPFRTLWAGQDPFVAVEALRGEVFRELAGRRTLRTEVDGRGYFVKIHRGVGWSEIVKNLVSLHRPVLGAGDEWRAVQRLHAAGIDTLRVVAYAQRGDDPARRASFIVSEELAPTISLEDYCAEWPRQTPDLRLKRALIRGVGEIASRMHQAGVNHRDFYLCHFLLHLDPPPTPERLRLSLIDLHRAQVRPHTPQRWRDKDLAALYFSVLGLGLSRSDYCRFLVAYFARPLRQVLRDEARLIAHLRREAQRLQARFVRKVARGEMT
ncbi:MAG TPA: lipopolysaccharide core heptose(I) kinase RfaP [Accumulibacter sp.]|uniref:lipopolysaccharide core heptose(I) kinase RfaP n=1 Tax=Accumulibacter sp. TaxID=2053492 RepID=UPI002878F1F6|nr:lipopolysaccharide core heptose(I) kinase RfaP [Accumulibacter sp.]MDS4053988.1 lipopolysaccharide core heptose(I) kinase RfaP [Accumulibacter sp.]HMV07119.1 lipopolysaccharide core heptose(I) kinase RfaP [Accumulibacter sp.]HMW63357.1 lipopolysaccharide core heptose(I) kinase RfaP [Accumulibacter sp.]HMW80247.1 lipopolysaccharide core heptose(I) kinase RfaP [Accumulibacter sp.]HNB67755.1 lipopolysaccharide core heptose(I) kinase RfaP [Accumulibacter sp.]